MNAPAFAVDVAAMETLTILTILTILREATLPATVASHVRGSVFR
jgi:hypothetical protein